MAGAAFFDLDRTLMAGSSAFQFGRAAYRAGMLTRRQLIADASANVRFRLHGSTDAGTEALRARLTRSIAGVPVRELERLGPSILAGVLPRIYPQMLALAWEHQDAGRPVYICTATGSEIAELLARVLIFDGALGTRSEIVDGRYTGEPLGPFIYREGKARAVRELTRDQGIDLADCYAYSDSESDLPLLELVGHAVVVNPDRALARIARERDWELLRFERLGRRLAIAGTGVAAAAVGGVGRMLVARRAAPARAGAPSIT